MVLAAAILFCTIFAHQWGALTWTRSLNRNRDWERERKGKSTQKSNEQQSVVDVDKHEKKEKIFELNSPFGVCGRDAMIKSNSAVHRVISQTQQQQIGSASLALASVTNAIWHYEIHQHHRYLSRAYNLDSFIAFAQMSCLDDRMMVERYAAIGGRVRCSSSKSMAEPYISVISEAYAFSAS